MAKRTHDTAPDTTPGTTPGTSTETDAPPTGALTWSDWFDHWPEMFARRWPESFRNMPFGPFGGETFRMEHLAEDDGTLVVRAELPGIDPATDVEIDVADGRIVISGERRERHEEKIQQGFRTEFQYGSFDRSFRLPAGACIDDITATYHDGILEIRIPVTEATPRATQIKISTD